MSAKRGKGRWRVPPGFSSVSVQIQDGDLESLVGLTGSTSPGEAVRRAVAVSARLFQARKEGFGVFLLKNGETLREIVL